MRRLLQVAVVVAVWSIVRPAPAAAAAPLLDWAIPNGHFYTETNGFPSGTSPMGFAVTNDSQADFWTAYQQLGGVTRLGYPASQRFMWKGFITQVMQKAVLQWRPKTQSVDFVNVFDELAASGRNAWLQDVQSVPPEVPANYDAGLKWPQIVSHRLALLKSHPALYKFYESQSDPLDLYGLPTSPVVDVGPMYVVRLQRAVLQEWKVAEPWAKPGEVTVANGGDVSKAADVFPWKAMRPVAPPVDTWPSTDSSYVITGTATWYGPGFDGHIMANGAVYNQTNPQTVASNAFPLGSQLRVTSSATKKSIDVTVCDTGRFNYPDVLDLSPAAFQALGGDLSSGVLPVSVELVRASAPPPSTTSNTQAPSR